MTDNAEDADIPIDLLAAASAAGDREAFERLMEGVYHTMYVFAYKWCGNREDAQDVTQNACIRLARAIGDFRGESAFTSWLYRLVVNTARDWQRSQRRHSGHLDIGLPEAEAALAAASPAGSHAGSHAGLGRRLDLAGVLSRLPEAEKEALILVACEGFTHAQTAAVLGCAEATVSWRIARAKKKLRQMMTDDEEDVT